MKEHLTQTLAQRQLMRLSPMQMQLARMLEMNEPEVEDEVRRQLDDNPALAEAENTDGKDCQDTEDFNETSEQLQAADFRDPDDIPSYRLDPRNIWPGDRTSEPLAADESSGLNEYLLRQLAEVGLEAQDEAVAGYVIGAIDDNGYLTRSLAEIQDDLAISTGVEVSIDTIASVVDLIRTFDPAGVAAYDLRQCLLLQLDRRKSSPAVDTATRIVAEYFDVYSQKHFDRLETALGISREQLRKADEVIRSLDPKPGAKYAESEAEARTNHIIPDFKVEIDHDGRLTVSMPSNIPDLVIESSFALPDADKAVIPAIGGSGKSQAEALAFIARKHRDASEFIELMKMRRNTLMKVMEAIARWQSAFFASETESDLRPMVLRDVADATGLDLSTVSRATAGKYVATEGGVYPLKFFFNEKVNDKVGVSSREILSAIHTLINEENPSSPLSDDELSERLRALGYGIARRTVSKYRERLGLPAARLRRKI